MREILFRGKLHDGRWSEGNLCVSKDGVCIITPDATPVGCYGRVDPDTVGQYTGLTDSNGKKIFEGDIIEAVLPETASCARFAWPLKKVEFRDGSFVLVGADNINFAVFGGFAPSVTLEVKGDIHDTPELLKGGAKS